MLHGGKEHLCEITYPPPHTYPALSFILSEYSAFTARMFEASLHILDVFYTLHVLLHVKFKLPNLSRGQTTKQKEEQELREQRGLKCVLFSDSSQRHDYNHDILRVSEK